MKKIQLKEGVLKQIITESVNAVLNDISICNKALQSVLDFASDVDFYDLNKMKSYVTIENEETLVRVNFSYDYDYTRWSSGSYDDEPQNPSINITAVDIVMVAFWDEGDSSFHSVSVNSINQSLITEIKKCIVSWLTYEYDRGGYKVDEDL